MRSGSITVRAFPKVNLHLSVGPKRPDGFHSIISLFQRIHCVWDTLSVCFEPVNGGESFVQIHGLEGLIDAGKSILYKTVQIWSGFSGIYGRVNIDVDRKIPDKSGLGGASSDAAAVLLALDKLSGRNTAPETLVSLASGIGSDVPFFASDTEAAVVTGRGEFVKPVSPRTDLNFSLLAGDILKAGTAEAYSELDMRETIPGFPTEKELLESYYGPVENWNFHNDFEALYKRPDIDLHAGEKLFLTGSGNYWFRVSENPKKLKI